LAEAGVSLGSVTSDEQRRGEVALRESGMGYAVEFAYVMNEKYMKNV